MEQSDFVHTGQKVGLVMAPSSRRRPWRRRCRSARGRTRASSPGLVDRLALPAGTVRPGRHRRRGPAVGWRPGRCSPPTGPMSGGRSRPSAASWRWRRSDSALATYLDRRGVTTAEGRRPAPGSVADGLHGSLWDACSSVRRPAYAGSTAFARSRTDGSPPCPCRSRWAWRPRRSSSALVAPAPTAVSTRPVTSRPSGTRRRRWRPRGALRRRLGRAVDGRAGAPTRPRRSPRCRARVAGRLARGVRGRSRRRRRCVVDSGHATDRGRDDHRGPVDARRARRVDGPDGERRPGEPRLVGLARARGETSCRHLRAAGTDRESAAPARWHDSRPTSPSRP